MERPVPLLLTAITEALEADTRISVDGLTISQNTDNGAITLEGRVPDISAKRRAANTAWSVVRGRCPIEDRLRVDARHEGPLELRDEVTRKLAAENMFSAHTLTVVAGSHRERLHDGGSGAPEIHVQVEDGVVTLTGTVASLGHRRFAEVLAWWAPACARVDNHLDVVPPEADDDDEITDVVRMVLEKDPLVHADQLRAGTAGGIVELTGLVGTEEERRLAVMDTWYVPGVWAVVDRITVRPASGT